MKIKNDITYTMKAIEIGTVGAATLYAGVLFNKVKLKDKYKRNLKGEKKRYNIIFLRNFYYMVDI